MLGLPRALFAVLVAAVVVVVAVFLPLPPPLVVGLVVLGSIAVGLVWLFN